MWIPQVDNFVLVIIHCLPLMFVVLEIMSSSFRKNLLLLMMYYVLCSQFETASAGYFFSCVSVLPTICNIIAWELININPYHQRQICRSVTLVSGNIYQFCIFELRWRFSQERRQTGVGSLKSTNLPFSRCYIFVSFRNEVGIIVHYNDTPLWISADTNKDDLELHQMPNST